MTQENSNLVDLWKGSFTEMAEKEGLSVAYNSPEVITALEEIGSKQREEMISGGDEVLEAHIGTVTTLKATLGREAAGNAQAAGHSVNAVSPELLRQKVFGLTLDLSGV